MKKLRIPFGIAGVILSVGGAFATQFLAPPVVGYERVTALNVCAVRTGPCTTTGTKSCTIISPFDNTRTFLKTQVSSTTCGTILLKD